MIVSKRHLTIIHYVIYVLGAKWYSRRKILTPTFHFNILQQFVEILIEEGENMTKSLKNIGGTVVKDLVSFASEHTLNAICGILFITIYNFILIEMLEKM